MSDQRAKGLFQAKAWIPREVWDLAGEVAKAQGTDRSKVWNEFLRWYVGRPGARLPTPAEPR